MATWDHVTSRSYSRSTFFGCLSFRSRAPLLLISFLDLIPLETGLKRSSSSSRMYVPSSNQMCVSPSPFFPFRGAASASFTQRCWPIQCSTWTINDCTRAGKEQIKHVYFLKYLLHKWLTFQWWFLLLHSMFSLWLPSLLVLYSRAVKTAKVSSFIW